METRASYLVVGIFTIGVIVAALSFVLWSARNEGGEFTAYDIEFTRGVAGLSEGNDVLFNGVRVGQVTQIKISPQNPAVVKVRIDVAADTPVRGNSQASLEMRGLTGRSSVAISGGSVDSPIIVARPGKVPVIESTLSGIQNFMATAPEVMNAVEEMIQRANGVLTPENTEAVSKTLTAVAELTTTLAARKDSINKSLSNIEEASRNFAEASRHINALSVSMRNLVDRNITQASSAISTAANTVETLMGTLAPSISQTAGELQRLLTEARGVMQRLNSISNRIDSDPRRFFFGTSTQEFSAP